MKRIHDLSKEEVLALNDEQIAKFVDYECAMNGAPLLPLMPEKPTLKKPEPDTVAYEVSVGYQATIYLANEFDAAEVLQLLKSMRVFRKDWSADILVPEPETTMRSIPIFSPDIWESVRAQKAAYDEAEKAYTFAKEEYDKAFSERQACFNEVWQIVREAREDEYRRNSITLKFNRYLELAEGNREIALRFLKNSGTVIPEGLEEELMAA